MNYALFGGRLSIYTRTGQVGLAFRGKIGVVHNNCFRVIPKDGIERDYLY